MFRYRKYSIPIWLILCTLSKLPNSESLWYWWSCYQQYVLITYKRFGMIALQRGPISGNLTTCWEGGKSNACFRVNGSGLYLNTLVATFFATRLAILILGVLSLTDIYLLVRLTTPHPPPPLIIYYYWSPSWCQVWYLYGNQSHKARWVGDQSQSMT